MHRTFSRPAAAVGLAVGTLGLLLTAGCGSQVVQYDETTIKASDQFRKISVAYNQASGRKRGKVAVDDLKPLLKEHGDPDKLLISPLDGEPIVIVPGVTPGAELGDDEQAIVAYEKTGKDGKRMTVDVRGTVVFVSDSEFATMKFAGGHKPAGR